REMTAGRRAEAFQALAGQLELPGTIVPELCAVYRAHAPALKLPAATRAVLEQARATWKLAVLTNGAPDIQRRKIAALGLAALVDAVVYAHVGDGETGPADATVRDISEVPWHAERLLPAEATHVL